MLPLTIAKNIVSKLPLAGVVKNTFMANMTFSVSFQKTTPAFDKLVSDSAIKALSNSLFWKELMVEPSKPTFTLGEGSHFLNFGDFFAILEIEEKDNTKNDGHFNPWKTEVLLKGTIHTNLWNREKLLKLIEGCLGECQEKPMIYLITSRRHQTYELNLDYANQKQYINKDVYDEIDSVYNRMANNKQWYIDNGVKHRETICLFGPPGTGKSTLVRHFAAKYGTSLTLTKPNCCNQFSHNGEGLIQTILFEDIDAEGKLLNTYVEGPMSDIDEFNYSDFINWLDGIIPLEGVIIVMTTNYKEKIRKAVLRNGRVTRKILLPYLTSDELIGHIGEKWRKEIESYEEGRITISMIPELSLATSTEEFRSLVDSLSNQDKDESNFDAK